MRSKTFLAACAALTALLCVSMLEAKPRRAAAHKTTTKSKTAKVIAKRGSRTSSKAVKSVRGNHKSRYSKHGHGVASRKTSSGPYRQLAPTQERYAEIQKALASRGYFTGEANGEWGPDSVAALKRFQADQNLTADGKINSLALIALGLGPKRETVGDFASRPATEPPANP